MPIWTNVVNYTNLKCLSIDWNDSGPMSQRASQRHHWDDKNLNYSLLRNVTLQFCDKTTYNSWVSTPSYQWYSGHVIDVTRASDIVTGWSSGVICWDILVGNVLLQTADIQVEKTRARAWHASSAQTRAIKWESRRNNQRKEGCHFDSGNWTTAGYNQDWSWSFIHTSLYLWSRGSSSTSRCSKSWSSPRDIITETWFPTSQKTKEAQSEYFQHLWTSKWWRDSETQNPGSWEWLVSNIDQVESHNQWSRWSDWLSNLH